jgi:hypothetical protein
LKKKYKMSTCKELAKRYANETKKNIPNRDETDDIKQKWLYQSEWKCYQNGEFKDPSNCDVCVDVNNNIVDCKSPSMAKHKPRFNFLNETGFLHWVNQRGFQCINRITGNFFGIDEKSGDTKVPSIDVPYPNALCSDVCFGIQSKKGDKCFECIKNALKSDPSLCPGINIDNEEDKNILHDSVNCHECIGTQSKYFEKTDEKGEKVEDVTKSLHNLWDCIDGVVKDKFPIMYIIYIVIGVIFLIAIVVTISLHFYFLKKKNEKTTATNNNVLSSSSSFS